MRRLFGDLFLLFFGMDFLDLLERVLLGFVLLLLFFGILGRMVLISYWLCIEEVLFSFFLLWNGRICFDWEMFIDWFLCLWVDCVINLLVLSIGGEVCCFFCNCFEGIGSLLIRLDNLVILLMLVINGLRVVDGDRWIIGCIIYWICGEELFVIIFLDLDRLEVMVEGLELDVLKGGLEIKEIFLLFLFCLRVGFKNWGEFRGVKVMEFFDCDWSFLNGEVVDVDEVFNIGEWELFKGGDELVCMIKGEGELVREVVDEFGLVGFVNGGLFFFFCVFDKVVFCMDLNVFFWGFLFKRGFFKVWIVDVFLFFFIEYFIFICWLEVRILIFCFEVFLKDWLLILCVLFINVKEGWSKIILVLVVDVCKWLLRFLFCVLVFRFWSFMFFGIVIGLKVMLGVIYYKCCKSWGDRGW